MNGLNLVQGLHNCRGDAGAVVWLFKFRARLGKGVDNGHRAIVIRRDPAYVNIRIGAEPGPDVQVFGASEERDHRRDRIRRRAADRQRFPHRVRRQIDKLQRDIIAPAVELRPNIIGLGAESSTGPDHGIIGVELRDNPLAVVIDFHRADVLADPLVGHGVAGPVWQADRHRPLKLVAVSDGDADANAPAPIVKKGAMD